MLSRETVTYGMPLDATILIIPSLKRQNTQLLSSPPLNIQWQLHMPRDMLPNAAVLVSLTMY